MKTIIPTCFVLLTLCILGCEQPREVPQDLQERIRQVENSLFGEVLIEGEGMQNIEERLAATRIRGVSIAVIKDYKLDWAKGYGWADEAEQRKVTTETLFQVASISKSLNAVGLLKLVQDGKIDLDADINTYLTSWKFPYDSVSKGRKITLAQLLSHTAGLNVHGFPGYAVGDSLPGVVEILDGKKPANSEAIRSMREPDQQPQYSGGGTTISQLMAMDVTKKPYDVFMYETVLKPLGMDASFYTQPAPASSRPQLATGYLGGPGGEVPGKYHIYPENAAAGLWTNPTDLSKYIIETQLSLQGKSSKVLTQQYTQKRLTPYRENVGLGVFIADINGAKYFEHSGSNTGFRSHYVGSMEGGNGMVVIVNSDDGAILREVLNSVAYVYQWKGFKLPPEKKVVKLSAEQLKPLKGIYALEGHPDRRLQFSTIEFPTGGEQLMLTELWSNRKVVFEAESDVSFFCKNFHFPLKFTRDDSGKGTQVVAFEHDVWKRVED
jgi:CubicO group peptidase (beta-lactamase class C family)